jgi:hypothetical protein
MNTLYLWLKVLHVTSVFAFLMLHTVQIVLSSFWPRFMSAGETKVADWLISSVRRPSFVVLGAVMVTGLLLVALTPGWLNTGWFWASIAILLIVAAGKWLAAGRRWITNTNVLTAIGISGLLILLWLMILKPF